MLFRLIFYHQQKILHPLNIIFLKFIQWKRGQSIKSTSTHHDFLPLSILLDFIQDHPFFSRGGISLIQYISLKNFHPQEIQLTLILLTSISKDSSPRILLNLYSQSRISLQTTQKTLTNPSPTSLQAVDRSFRGWDIGKEGVYINNQGMDYFESKRSRSRYSLDGSQDEFSYQPPLENKSVKNNHQHFQGLYAARERFCDFVNTLGPLRYTQIREDIMVHCEQSSKKQRIYQAFMSDQTILKIINLRIDKMIKNKRIKKNWSEEDVQILIWVVSKYADNKHFQDVEKDVDSQDWEMIASLIPGVTGESCMFKWLSLKKINLATNNWSEEESALLARLVNQKGFEGKSKDSKDWKLISQRLYFLNANPQKIFRNAKQCREHWNCYLNPNLKKGPWKPEQDIQLLKCIKQNKGSKKWSEIVKHFDGRTQNALKNRYTLIIEKQKKHNKHRNQLQIIEQYLVRCYVDQFTQMRQFTEEDQSSNSFSPKEMNSFDNRLNPQFDSFQEPKSTYQAPTTPITPIKVEKFSGFFEFLSKDRIDFNTIQLGTLNNGIFEKSQLETDKGSSSSSPLVNLKIKKYRSSFL